jgi:hypothetical protein
MGGKGKVDKLISPFWGKGELIFEGLIKVNLDESCILYVYPLKTFLVKNMNYANEIIDLITEMKDEVTEGNKDKLVPKILKEAISVWQHYIASKIELSLTETDLRLHIAMMKKLWDLADHFNVSEKVAFPILP